MPARRPPSLRRLLLTHEFAFLVLVLITGALATSWAVIWQQSSSESVRLNLLAHTAQEIRTLLFRQIQEVSMAGLREDPETRALNRRYSRTMRELFNELRRNSANRGEDYAVQNLQTAFSHLQADLRKSLDDPFELNRLVRAKLLDPAFQQRFVADFETAYESLNGLVDRQLDQQSVRLERWLEIAPYALTVPLLAGIVLLVFSRRSLTLGFVRPMRAIIAGTRRMSAGHLDEPLAEQGVEELRELARSINQMAADLESSRDALVEQQRRAALGALVPVVAHNVRNPLAAIRATAQLLDGDENPEDVRETRQAIIETVDRLGRWVTALVSYLHPLEPQTRSLPAAALLDATAALMATRLEALGVRLERGPWDAGAEIDADPELMEQALYGLVTNAVEASPRGATVTLSVERDAAAVRLQIADEAGGLPFRPEPSELTPGPSTKRFGTGLGIPIAFKICNAHGFRIEFDVQEGEGTRVIITAPPAGTNAHAPSATEDAA